MPLATRTLPAPRLLTRAAATSLAVWTAVMVVALTRSPAGDYAVYRALAPAVLDPRALYQLRLGPLAFTYPSFAALPLSALASVGFGLGLALMSVASVAALVRTVVVLTRAVRRERAAFGLPELPLSPAALLLVALAVAVWFVPVTKTLLNGQVNLLLLWLVAEDLYGDVPSRARGVLTGIATGIKLTPGLFVVTMLVTGRRASGLRAVVTFVVTVAVGFAFEPSGSAQYWQHLGAGNGYGHPLGYGNQSALYALVRLGGGPWTHYLVVGVAIAAVALVLARRLAARGRELAMWGVITLAILAVSPIAWDHQWVWALIPLAAVLAAPLTTGSRGLLVAAVVVLASGVVSLAAHLHPTGLARPLVGVLGDAYLLLGVALLVRLARLGTGPPTAQTSRPARPAGIAG